MDLGKTPASCSAICQSSDAAPTFKALKKALKSVRDRPYKDAHHVTVTERQLTSALATRTFTADKRQKLVDALLQILFTMRNVITFDSVVAGYRTTGQYPFSFRTAMAKCTRQLSAEQYAVIEESLPAMVTLFRRHGKITEADMDAAGIFSCNAEADNKKPKDQRALHQQRACMMNAEESCRQYAAYEHARRVSVPQRRMMAQAARTERAGARTVEEAEKQARKAAKEQEKTRRAALTEEQRKTEDREKRRLAKRRREDRLLQQADAAAAAAAPAADGADAAV
jgi:hypothetical protein